MGKSSRMVTGALVALLGIVSLSSSFGSTPACPWADQNDTPASCSGEANYNGNVVSFAPCVATGGTVGPMLQFGMAVNTAPTEACWMYKCNGGCLKTTQDCNDGVASGQPKHECVGGATQQDVRPLAIFIYVPMIMAGFLLIANVVKPAKIMLAGILFVAAGWWLLERSIEIQAGCPSDMVAFCGNGGANNTRSATNTVTLTPCAGMGSAPAAVSPFATNLPAINSCRNNKCGPKQCVRTTTPCEGTPTPVFECVDQQSVSSAAPVNLFFGMILVLLGGAMTTLDMALKMSSGGGTKAEGDPLVR